MGVTGLWRLIEPAGKPVPVETLENKVLAVDISIWLHQMVKGYQDAKGAPLPNAHLMGLFQRLCKLLYFRIKPIFVFDGGVPDLKKETIGTRQASKNKYNSESERLKRELALLLSKKSAVNSLLGKQISPKKSTNNIAIDDGDLFKLPALPENKEETESESEDETNSSSGSLIDLHSVDIQSDKFKNLPVKEKYDLLIELKETRKMNSWGKIHELPKKSDNFSDFQMQRLLKRRKVQECLEETEKEMGDGGLSLNDLESLLNEEGIDTKIETLPTRRIASSNSTRFLLINDVKQALAEAKKKAEDVIKSETSEVNESLKSEVQDIKKDELEDDLEKAIKLSLECVDDHNITKTDESWTSVMSDSEFSNECDSEENDEYDLPDMSSAKAYIMQYSDFTNKAIDKIVSFKNTSKKNPTLSNIDDILSNINKEKSVIAGNIDLSSDDEVNDIKKEELVIAENIDLSSADKVKKSILSENNFKLEQAEASVICFGNLHQDVITLDTSNEDIANSNQSASLTKDNSLTVSQNKQDDIEIFDHTDSNDSEFEDVPDLENESRKTVVELNLDINKQCDDEEDIFADIFVPEKAKYLNVNKKESKNSEQLVENTNNKAVNTEKRHNVAETIEEYNIKSKNESTSKNENISTPVILTKTVQNDTNISEDVNSSSQTNIKSHPTNNDAVADGSKDNQASTSRQILPKNISKEELNEMAEKMATEEQDLIQEKGRLERFGRNITEQMTKEAQELLQIFGIPYIVAPMEAEAQCAFLETINLTDGTITDDSDIWLFGGNTVYKNFFNQKKHVLQYQSERIEKSYNLSREKLVLLALLVGSDYTVGVDGIGPVTAMEILSSFPYNRNMHVNETSQQTRYQQIVTGLQEFKKWMRSGKRTDNTILKKKLRNVTVKDDFPSIRVVRAYLEPNIEKSKEKFTWGELDITVLREYTKSKFGWSQSKLDEIINPVLKRITTKKSQKSVHDYFKRKIEFQSLEDQMSKRVKAAVLKMNPDFDAQAIGDAKEPVPPKKKKVTKSARSKKTDIGFSKLNCKEPSTSDSIPNNVVSSIIQSKSDAEIVIPKTQRFQEIIPQREKDKRSLLENKLKAIEVFRKTKIDRRKKPTKRRALVPKDEAELSESSDTS